MSFDDDDSPTNGPAKPEDISHAKEMHGTGTNELSACLADQSQSLYREGVAVQETLSSQEEAAKCLLWWPSISSGEHRKCMEKQSPKRKEILKRVN